MPNQSSFTQLYDPDYPDEPGGAILRANFDPRKHRRWSNRPLAQTRQWFDLELCSEGQHTALAEASMTNARSVLLAGFDELAKLQGLSKPVAKKIHAWCVEHHGERFDAERKAAEPVPAQPEAPAPEAVPVDSNLPTEENG